MRTGRDGIEQRGRRKSSAQRTRLDFRREVDRIQLPSTNVGWSRSEARSIRGLAETCAAAMLRTDSVDSTRLFGRAGTNVDEGVMVSAESGLHI